MIELEYLRDRSLLIVDFLISKDGSNQFAKQFKLIINETYSKKNLKGLKTLSRDLNAWSKSLSKKDFEELEVLLEARFGENLSGDKITHFVINQALKNGKIDNRENYRVVHEYLLDISESDPYFSKLDNLELMLREYDRKLKD